MSWIQMSSPLEWPPHVPRAEARKPALFGRKKSEGWGLAPRTEAEARNYVRDELERLGADMVVISSNFAINRDDWSFTANRRQPEDPGIAVYFDLEDERQVIAIDVYLRAADNLWAVGRTIEALRQIARDGGPRIMRTAVSGFKLIPERTSGFTWWRVLGFEDGAALTSEDVRAAYKRLAWERHPDRGGTEEEFVQLQEAMRQGLAVVDGRVA